MFVFSNLAISLDGKIAPASREEYWLGTPYDRQMMQTLRRRSDVVVMGASTLRTYKKFCGLRAARRQPANAILSRALEGISPDWPFFQDPSKRRFLFVTGKVPAKKLHAFRSTSEVIQLKPPGRGGSIAPLVLRELGKRGMERVLVEGGGGVMWDFVSQDLVDEYNVTLTPQILGGIEAPTLVEGAGFRAQDILKLKLLRSRRVGDELYLRYGRA